MRQRIGTAFQSLQVRNYRLFATGQLIKLIGMWILFTAQDWLVLELTHNSATALGTVTALQFSPVLLLTLYGGALADRYDKRKMLLATNVAMSVLVAIQAVLVVTGTVRLWHVFVFALLLGAQGAMETPTRQAFISELVPGPLLPNALGLSSATFNASRIIGPAIAGLLIAQFDLGPTFLASIALAVAPMVTLRLMRSADLYREERVAGAPRTPSKLTDGLRYVAKRPDLMLPIGLIAALGLIAFNFQVTLATLAKAAFHTGAGSFGLLTTALASGALIGALAGSSRRRRPSIYVVLGAGMAFGVLETAVGFAPTFASAAILLVPTGFFMILFAQAANQRVQMGTDQAVRGRVMALYVLVFLGTTPIGAPLVGWIAEHESPGAAIWVGGVCAIAVCTVGLVWKLQRTGERLRINWLPVPRFSVTSDPTL